MRAVIAAVGRARAGPERDLYDHYRGRITKQIFSRLILKEVEPRQSLPAKKMIEQEGALLMAAVPPGAYLIALDEGGKQLGSTDLAKVIGAQRDAGVGDLAFVIGGADGLSAALRAQADRLLSFGAVTWPHLLVRALLIEQLYRVQCILTDHPYHRG